MAKWDDRKAVLEARQSALLAQINEIEVELEAPATKDAEDRATEREDDEVLQGVAKGAQHEIEMIRAALGRIENDEYGICQTCGDRISTERLDLLPFTPFCRRCAV